MSRVVTIPPRLRLHPQVIEGAPVHVCRIWHFGDERRGMRSHDCMVAHCPHTLAVSDGFWHLDWNYICEDDARSYGLLGPAAA